MRYAITDRHLLPGDEAERRRGLVLQAERLGRQGVEYLQVREKHLTFEAAARLALELQEAAGSRTQVLLNAPWQPGWPAGIGIHVPVATAQRPRATLVSASCHSIAEAAAAWQLVDLLLFAPVFEKRVRGEHVQDGVGLALLAEVCAAVAPLPVFALGGVTWANAPACTSAGAAGVAGIRLFL